jgi:hypothetical protein
MAPGKSKLAKELAPVAKRAKQSNVVPEPFDKAPVKVDDKPETVDRGGSSRFLTSVKYHIDGTLTSPLKDKAQIALQVLVTRFSFVMLHILINTC